MRQLLVMLLVVLCLYTLILSAFVNYVENEINIGEEIEVSISENYVCHIANEGYELIVINVYDAYGNGLYNIYHDGFGLHIYSV